MATVSAAVVQDEVVAYFDEWWRRYRERLEGLTQAEFEFEPAPSAWSVLATTDGPQVERIEPEPDPPPITTIGWRMWHIAVECLDGYAGMVFGSTATGLADRAFTLDVQEAVELTACAAVNFRDGLIAQGPDWLFDKLGPAYGLYADSTFLGLMLHVIDELVHHSAEIALLRDLYRAGARI